MMANISRCQKLHCLYFRFRWQRQKQQQQQGQRHMTLDKSHLSGPFFSSILKS